MRNLIYGVSFLYYPKLLTLVVCVSWAGLENSLTVAQPSPLTRRHLVLDLRIDYKDNRLAGTATSVSEIRTQVANVATDRRDVDFPVVGQVNWDQVARYRRIARVYGAVRYFHPDVAPYPSARRAWNEVSARALEAFRAGNTEDDSRVFEEWLATLNDPATSVSGSEETGLDLGSTPQRAWAYSGYAPDVRQLYQGSYQPFTDGWRAVSGDEALRWSTTLPNGQVVNVRFGEAGDPDETVPDSAEARAGIVDSTRYPPLGQRLLAAVIVWNVVQNFYPYRDLTGEDWDLVLYESLGRLGSAQNVEEYLRGIAWMATRLHDSHAAVLGDSWNQIMGPARPPVGIQLVDGQAVVTGVVVDSIRVASGLGLRAGDLILAVDGVSIGKRLDSLRATVPASTPQAFNDHVGNKLLGVGLDGEPVRLAVLSLDCRRKEVIVHHTSQRWWVAHRSRADTPIWRRIGENIGYIDLTRLSRESVSSAFADLADTQALIMDMRGYPKGTAWLIAPRLTDEDSVLVSQSWIPQVISPNERDGRWTDSWVTLEGDPPHYAGQTVLLINEQAVSQAEYTAMMFRAANQTIIVGSRSAGANGDITDVALPGDIGLGFTGKGSRLPGGYPIQRRGIIPDVLVSPTIDDIRNGRNIVLERAIELFE